MLTPDIFIKHFCVKFSINCEFADENGICLMRDCEFFMMGD